MTEDKWKNNYKSKFEDFKTTSAPKLSWEDIQSGLEVKPVPHRQWIGWSLAFATAAVSLVILLKAPGTAESPTETDKPVMAQVIGDTPSKTSIGQTRNIQTATMKHSDAPRKPKANPDREEKSFDTVVLTTADENGSDGTEGETEGGVVADEVVETPNSTSQRPQNGKEEQIKQSKETKPQTNFADDDIHFVHKSHRSGKLTASLQGSNPGAMSKTGQSVTPVLVAAPAFGDDRSMESMSFNAGESSILSDEKHYRPIRLGLSVRYAFDDRLRLESGLTYNILRSEFTYSGTSSDEVLQTLNYLGVPLRFSCRLFDAGNFSFYVSAGGLAEKMIRGTSKSGVDSESIAIKPLQFSVDASLGAEYRIGERLSIYAEPEVSRYFDNGSGVKSYYTDRPVSFNLNIGLRIDLSGR